MFRRAFWLCLLLVSSQLASGCCYWCHRPFFFRRGCECGYGGGCTTCCSDAGATHMDYGPPPIAPTGPTMPNAVPLTRR